MKRCLLILCLVILLFLSAGTATLAAIEDYDLSWWTIDNGGGTSKDEVFELSGTIGQPDVGVLTGEEYILSGGFWFPDRWRVFLPINKSYKYAPLCSPANSHCEDNNTSETAYGPLQPGTAYSAYPQDLRDYYYFELFNSSKINIQVSNFMIDDTHGQLQLLDDKETLIVGDYSEDNGMSITNYPLPAGKYYILIALGLGHYNPDEFYNLTWNFQP